MSWLTTLCVFPSSCSATEQLFSLKKSTLLKSRVRAVFETADSLIVNLSESEDEGGSKSAVKGSVRGDNDSRLFEPLKIEDVRELQLKISFAPVHHELRVIVIGNLELASLPAQQALLKLLEEPPEYIQVIVTTTDQSALLPTILSRCQVINFSHELEKNGDSPKKPLRVPPELTRALDTLPSKHLSLKTVFTLSEQYKERPDALSFLADLTETVRSRPRYPSPELTQLGQHILHTTELLKKNVNVRLALEQLLFFFIERQ